MRSCFLLCERNGNWSHDTQWAGKSPRDNVSTLRYINGRFFCTYRAANARPMEIKFAGGAVIKLARVCVYVCARARTRPRIFTRMNVTMRTEMDMRCKCQRSAIPRYSFIDARSIPYRSPLPQRSETYINNLLVTVVDARSLVDGAGVCAHTHSVRYSHT